MKYLSLSCALLIGILAILSISHVSCQETNHCKQDIANYLDDSSQTPVSDEQAKKEARKVDKLLESLRYKTIERELKKRVLSAVMDIYSLINDLNKILLDLKALSPHTAFGEVDQIKPREPSSELILKAMRDLTNRATMARRPEFAKQQARPMQDDQQARQAQETEKARQGREDEDKKSQSRTFATPATEAPSDEAAVAGDDYAKRFAEIHTPEEQEKFEKWMDKTRKKYGDIDFGPRKQELMERYMNEKQSGKPLDKALKILEKAYEDEYEDQKKEKKIAEKKAKMNPKQLQKFEEGEEKRRQRKFKKQQEKDDDLSTEGIMNSLGDALSGLFSW